MKTKLILIAALAAALGATAGWFAPHQLTAAPDSAAADRKILYYICPMHPSVKSDKPGNCPECGMKLQPIYADATGTNAAPKSASGCCSF